MENKTSHAHHYLPSKYLQGFTNPWGQFFVYDKNQDKIFSQTPDTFFLENNLNTIHYPNGTTADFLENKYTEVENRCWPSLENIWNSNYKNPIQPLDKCNLLLFISYLHWRLPSNVDHVVKLSEDMIKGNNTLDFVKLIDSDDDPQKSEIREFICRSEGFQKCLKLIMPLALFKSDQPWEDQINRWRFLYAPNRDNCFMTGDNPIIANGENDHDIMKCLREYIFPVSGRILLINMPEIVPKIFSAEFVFTYCKALIARSKRFVASPNRTLLEKVVEDYKLNKSTSREKEAIATLIKMITE